MFILISGGSEPSDQQSPKSELLKEVAEPLDTRGSDATVGAEVGEDDLAAEEKEKKESEKKMVKKVGRKVSSKSGEYSHSN